MAYLKRVYAARDFAALMDELEVYIGTNYPELWDSFLRESDAVRMLAEIVCYIGDNLNFYLDSVFNEMFIDTVQERENMMRLCKLIGYVLRNRSAAVGEFYCEPQVVYSGTLRIAKGTRIRSSRGDINFEVSADTIIEAGLDDFTLAVVQGDTVEDRYYGDGTPYQVSVTSRSGVAYNADYSDSEDAFIKYVGVSVAGVPWLSVRSVWQEGAEDVFHTEIMNDLRVRVVFGDGVHGNMPGVDEEIVLTYLYTVGVDGNLKSGSINTNISGIDNGGSGVAIDVKVTDRDGDGEEYLAVGGEAEESVEEARINAPLSLMAQDRLVTAEDFRVFCEAYSGVLRAKVVSIPGVHILDIYLLSTDYGAPSQAIKDALLAEINEKQMAGVDVYLQDPTLVYVDIEGKIFVKATYDAATVAQNVRSVITAYFKPPVDEISLSEINFGRDIHFSDIVALIEGVDGIDYVDMSKLTLRPVVEYGVWPNHDSGEPLYADVEDLVVNPVCLTAETWTVVVQADPTKFTVLGSISGAQADGTVGTPYTTDAGGVTFTVVDDDSILTTGDTASFRVSKYLGNVDTDDSEFPQEGTVSITY